MKLLLLLLAFAISPATWASFSETNKRYLAPRDLFNLLEQKFPVIKIKPKLEEVLSGDCWAITNTNRNSLGVVQPATGRASYSKPGANFVGLLTKCVTRILNLQFSELRELAETNSLWQKYYPAQFLDLFRGPNKGEEGLKLLYKKPWQEVATKDRNQIVTHAIYEMLGPEPLLKEMGFINGSQSLLSDINQAPFIKEEQLAIVEITMKIYLFLALRDEFYKY